MEHIVEQRSDEWFALRLGSVGASQIADATAKTKSGMSAGARNAIARVVAERLSGKFAESFVSPAMQRGIELEEQARDSYEFITGKKVRECGLFTHETIEGTHASPDGIVVGERGDEGVLEIKCPQAAAHLETLLKQTVPSQYVKQIQWQLACTGLPWCDFVSFNPDFPAGLDLLIIGVERDEELISELETAIGVLQAEANDIIRRLHDSYDIDV